jgi:hypothetical protein
MSGDARRAADDDSDDDGIDVDDDGQLLDDCGALFPAVSHLQNRHLWSLSIESAGKPVLLRCTAVELEASVSEEQLRLYRNAARELFARGIYQHQLQHLLQHQALRAAASLEVQQLPELIDRHHLPPVHDYWRLALAVDDVRTMHLVFEDANASEIDLTPHGGARLRLLADSCIADNDSAGCAAGRSHAAVMFSIPIEGMRLGRRNKHTDMHVGHINVSIRHQYQSGAEGVLQIAGRFEVKCSALHGYRSFLSRVVLSAHPHAFLALLARKVDAVEAAGVPTVL